MVMSDGHGVNHVYVWDVRLVGDVGVGRAWGHIRPSAAAVHEKVVVSHEKVWCCLVQEGHANRNQLSRSPRPLRNAPYRILRCMGPALKPRQAHELPQ